MAGLIDKKIKTINTKIITYRASIKAKNIDIDLLKGVLGKNGIIELSCKLGNDRRTGFHQYVAKCRAEYKGAKFVSMDAHISNFKNQYVSSKKFYNRYTANKKKLNERCIELKKDVFNGMKVDTDTLKTDHPDLKLQDPNAEDYKKYLFELPEENELYEIAETHNKKIADISLSMTSAISDAFAEKSALSKTGAMLREAFTDDYSKMLKRMKCSKRNRGGWGILLNMLSAPYRTAWNTYCALFRGALATLASPLLVAGYSFGKAHSTLMQIQKCTNQIEKDFKSLQESSGELKHSAAFILNDQSARVNLGERLEPLAEQMMCPENLMGSKAGKFKGSDVAPVSKIRNTRKDVAELICQLSKELQGEKTEV